MRKVVYLSFVILLSCFAWGDQISLGATAAIASGSATVYNNETHNLGTGSDIWMYLKGNAISSEPLLLIIGIPNDPGGSLLTASSVTGATLWNSTQTTPIAGTVGFSGSTGYSSITSHNTLGYAGSFSSGDLYKSFFGIKTITNSNQFQANWQAWDQAIFPAIYPPPTQPINFGIYVYALSFAGGDFASKGDNYVEVNLPGGLPLGSYAVGYSLDISSKTMTDNFTPFTTAGIVVPEPATLMLLGSGLSAIGFWKRR